MIRSKRVDISLLGGWITNQTISSGIAGSNYRLRLWHENSASISAVQGMLKEYFAEAHDDARRRIRKGFEDDLSPFNDASSDPAANYPWALGRVTLQGYLGETMAILLVEHLGAHGHNDWQTPAFLFRYHDVELQHLDWVNERLMEGVDVDLDAPRERRPGEREMMVWHFAWMRRVPLPIS